MTAIDSFPPLQGGVAQAESWTRHLTTRRPELGGRPAEEVATSLEFIVWYGVKLGEILPLHWSIVFDNLFRPGQEAWTTVKEFEAARQAVRHLFFTVREAMEGTLQIAQALQGLAGRKPAGLDRLRAVIADARRLEETVFRDWPSFADPVKTTNALPVDESLAEALGITVGDARQKMDARRRERNAGRE
jgi:hypothetical protein